MHAQKSFCVPTCLLPMRLHRQFCLLAMPPHPHSACPHPHSHSVHLPVLPLLTASPPYPAPLSTGLHVPPRALHRAVHVQACGAPTAHGAVLPARKAGHPQVCWEGDPQGGRKRAVWGKGSGYWEGKGVSEGSMRYICSLCCANHTTSRSSTGVGDVMGSVKRAQRKGNRG